MLYRSVLEFQVKIVCQLDRSAPYRFLRILVEADGWKEQLQQIRWCEASGEIVRLLLDTKERRQGMENLESRLREIDAEMEQHSDTLLSKLEASREDQSRWHLS